MARYELEGVDRDGIRELLSYGGGSVAATIGDAEEMLDYYWPEYVRIEVIDSHSGQLIATVGEARDE